MKDSFNLVVIKNAERLREFAREIVRLRPDLAHATLTQPERGLASAVLMTEREVFKGSLRDHGRAKIDLEWRILTMLQGKGLPVPEVTCAAADGSFFGMTKLDGIMLESVFTELDGAAQAAIASQVADIMTGIRKAGGNPDFLFKPSEGYCFGENAEGCTQHLHYLATLPDVTAALAQEPDVSATIDAYLGKLGYRPEVLLHGDLHGGNILIDPETNRVTGIIDFGCARRTRAPEDELLDLSHLFNQAFGLAARAAYTANDNHVTAKDVCIYEFLHALDMFGGGNLGSYTEAAASVLKSDLLKL